MEVVNALGRRKRAVARVFVSEGTGKITINKRDLAQYFPSTILQYVVKQPLNKLEAAEKYDIKGLWIAEGNTAVAFPYANVHVPDITPLLLMDVQLLQVLIQIPQVLSLIHISEPTRPY